MKENCDSAAGYPEDMVPPCICCDCVSKFQRGQHIYFCLKKKTRKAQEGLNLYRIDRAGVYYFLENRGSSQDREIETESPKFTF